MILYVYIAIYGSAEFHLNSMSDATNSLSDLLNDSAPTVPVSTGVGEAMRVLHNTECVPTNINDSIEIIHDEDAVCSNNVQSANPPTLEISHILPEANVTMEDNSDGLVSQGSSLEFSSLVNSTHIGPLFPVSSSTQMCGDPGEVTLLTSSSNSQQQCSVSEELQDLMNSVNNYPKDVWLQKAIEYSENDSGAMNETRIKIFGVAKTMPNFPRPGELVRRTHPRSATGKSLSYKLAEDCYRLCQFINGASVNEIVEVLAQSCKHAARSSVSTTPVTRSMPYNVGLPDIVDNLQKDFDLFKNETNDKVDKLKCDIKMWEAKCKSLEKTNAQTEKTLRKVQSDLKTYKDTCDKLSKAANKTNAQNEKTLQNVQNELSSYKNKCDELSKAAEAAKSRRAALANDETNSLQWRKGIAAKLGRCVSEHSKISKQVNDLEGIFGSHVSVCNTKSNYLEGKLDNQGASIKQHDGKLKNLKQDVKNLKEPSTVEITSVKAELKRLGQSLKDIEYDIGECGRKITSNERSMNKLRDKVNNTDLRCSVPPELARMKETQAMLAEQLELLTKSKALVTQETQTCMQQTNVSFNTQHGHPVSCTQNGMQSFDTYRSEQNGNGSCTPGDMCVMYGPVLPPEMMNSAHPVINQNGSAAMQCESVSHAHEQPISVRISTNCASQHLGPVVDDEERNFEQPISVRITAEQPGFKKYRQQQKMIKYYVGNIPSDVNEHSVRKYCVKWGLNPTVISLKPNSTNPSFLGAKIHVPKWEKDLIESNDFWPEGVYARRWVPQEKWDTMMEYSE